MNGFTWVRGEARGHMARSGKPQTYARRLRLSILRHHGHKMSRAGPANGSKKLPKWEGFWMHAAPHLLRLGVLRRLNSDRQQRPCQTARQCQAKAAICVLKVAAGPRNLALLACFRVVPAARSPHSLPSNPPPARARRPSHPPSQSPAVARSSLTLHCHHGENRPVRVHSDAYGAHVRIAYLRFHYYDRRYKIQHRRKVLVLPSMLSIYPRSSGRRADDVR